MTSNHNDFIEVENTIYDAYKLNYKSKLVSSRCPLDNKKYICDKLKLVYLTENIFVELDLVEIKKSSIHGNGLFAKTDIKINDLITFYPGDIVKYYPNGDGHIDGHNVMRFNSNRFENKFGKTYGSSFNNNDYAYDINNKYTLIGNPLFINDTNYMGHFINDGAKCSSDIKSQKIYNKISYIKSNCKFYNLKGDLHVAIIATKDISAGDELFIMYGIGYWHSYNKKLNMIKSN